MAAPVDSDPGQVATDAIPMTELQNIAESLAEAARWFDNTIKIDPSRAIAYLNLGDALVRAGEKERARKAYRTYLELAPSGAGAAHARQLLEKALEAGGRGLMAIAFSTKEDFRFSAFAAIGEHLAGWQQ